MKHEHALETLLMSDLLCGEGVQSCSKMTDAREWCEVSLSQESIHRSVTVPLLSSTELTKVRGSAIGASLISLTAEMRMSQEKKSHRAWTYRELISKALVSFAGLGGPSSTANQFSRLTWYAMDDVKISYTLQLLQPVAQNLVPLIPSPSLLRSCQNRPDRTSRLEPPILSD